MGNIVLKDPLWFLALVPLALVLWLRGRRAVPVLLVPFAAAWHRPSLAAASRWPVWLAVTGLVLLAAGLARPQRIEDKREVHSQGYDLMLCIDLSGSMLSEDYEKDGHRLNRLQAIQPVIESFINRRPNDRIGIVVFAEQAYTLAPLTFDHDWLARQVERLHIGVVGPYGTAIGDGLGVALTRLEQTNREIGGKRQGAFIVLLTDGYNNRGVLSPSQATEIAKSRGVPVYTIGAGKSGYVLVPEFDQNGNKIGYSRELSDLDEGALRDIASATGGQFYRADDTHTIESAFTSIDQTQKIEFQAKSYLITTELFGWPAAPGAGCLLLAALFARRRSARGPAASDSAGTRPAPVHFRPTVTEVPLS